MNERLFENKTDITKEGFIDVQLQWIAITRKKEDRKVYLLSFLLFFVGGFLALRSNIMDSRETMLAIVGLFFIILALALIFINSKSNRRKQLKRQSKEFIPQHIQYYFLEDTFILENDGSTSSIQYNKITMVYETKNMYFLACAYKQFYFIDKNNFENNEAFSQFLQRKFPNTYQKYN